MKYSIPRYEYKKGGKAKARSLSNKIKKPKASKAIKAIKDKIDFTGIESLTFDEATAWVKANPELRLHRGIDPSFSRPSYQSGGYLDNTGIPTAFADNYRQYKKMYPMTEENKDTYDNDFFKFDTQVKDSNFLAGLNPNKGLDKHLMNEHYANRSIPITDNSQQKNEKLKNIYDNYPQYRKSIDSYNPEIKNTVTGLASFQRGGQFVNINGNRYNTSSPEYKKLYDQGQVMAVDSEGLPTMYAPEATSTTKAPDWLKVKRGQMTESMRRSKAAMSELGKEAAEQTGIAGTYRFGQDPVGNLKGAYNYLNSFGPTMGAFSDYNPDEDPEKFWNTVDAAGFATAGTAAVKPFVSKYSPKVINYLTKNRIPKELGNVKTAGFMGQLPQNFQSEIDWSKWNPETPNYPELIDEYNTIEEATKKAGTWMKTPTGKSYKGTPEQFIQEQSSHFKKAFPEGYNNVFRGTYDSINDFSEGYKLGNKGIFAADYNLAYQYAPKGSGILTPFDSEGSKGVYNLIHPKGKNLIYDTQMSHWAEINLNPDLKHLQHNLDYQKKHLEKLKSNPEASKELIESQADNIKKIENTINNFDNLISNPEEFKKLKDALGLETTTDDIANYIENTDLNSIDLNNIIDGGYGNVSIINSRPGNYLKSRVGNVGFFDMTNPNIYKGLTPIGIATGAAATQLNRKEYQKGGNVIINGKRYNTNSKEYRDLYNTGTIASVDAEGVPTQYISDSAWDDYYENKRKNRVADNVRRGTGQFTKGLLQGAGAGVLGAGEIATTPIAMATEFLSGRGDYKAALPNANRILSDVGIGEYSGNRQQTPGSLVSDNPFVQVAVDLPIDIATGRAVSKYGPKVVSYADDVLQTSIQAGKPKLPIYKNIYRWQPDVVPEWLEQAGKQTLTPEQQALTGSWYGLNPNLSFYMRTRPGSGTVLHSKLPEYKIKRLQENMPSSAKGMSGKSVNVASAEDYHPDELIVPKDYRNINSKNIRFDINPHDYIEYTDEYKTLNEILKNNTGLSIKEYEEQLLPQYKNMNIDKATNMFLNNIVEDKHNKKLLGIPSKYIPFKHGGLISQQPREEYQEGGRFDKYNYKQPMYNQIAKTFATPHIAANTDKDFIRRIVDPKLVKPIIYPNGEPATHKMMSTDYVALPTIRNEYGELVDYSGNDVLVEGMNKNFNEGEYIELPSTRLANKFASEYKAFWNDNVEPTKFKYQEGGSFWKTGRFKYSNSNDKPKEVEFKMSYPESDATHTVDSKTYNDVDEPTQQMVDLEKKRKVPFNHHPVWNALEIAEPWGVASYPDVYEAWSDGKFNYNDITEPLGALPVIKYLKPFFKSGFKGEKLIPKYLPETLNTFKYIDGADDIYNDHIKYRNGGQLPCFTCGGYIHRNKMQSGGQFKPVSQVYTEKTGEPWQMAKQKGLTDGSYEANIKLLEKLNNNEIVAQGASFFKPNRNVNVKPVEPVITKPNSGGIFSPIVNQVNSINNVLSEKIKENTGFEDWDKIKEENNRINKLSDIEKINYYKKKNDPNSPFVVIDKKNSEILVYNNANSKPIKRKVSLGKNQTDAQTVTKYRDINNDGKITDADKVNGKFQVDWDAGNMSTGAGRYYISNIDKKGYYDLPLINMMNERQYDEYLKTGKVENVATSIHKGYDPRQARISNGCVRGDNCTLDDVSKITKNNNEVYILPEEKGNRFVYENGKLNFKVDSRKINPEWQKWYDNGNPFAPMPKKYLQGNKYEEYVDSKGRIQKGQGINKSVNTLNYIPIKTALNPDFSKRSDIKDDQYNERIVPFVKSLEEGKQDIMKLTGINGDVYNEIAKMTFGIYGAETRYGMQYGTLGNFGRAIGKWWDPKNSSSPDYNSKYNTYGATSEDNSVGLTQLRWSFLNDKEKAVLKELGITSNKDFMLPENAAVGTAAVLAVRYQEQLTEDQKQQMWNHLPNKWNARPNYPQRVSNNSKNLKIYQKIINYEKHI